MAKRQYGIMPPFPKVIAMLRGSDTRHFVYGIDWLGRTIAINRRSRCEQIPIERAKFVEPTPEELEILNSFDR